MINSILTLIILVILIHAYNAGAIAYDKLQTSYNFTDHILVLTKTDIEGLGLINSASKPELHISQLSEETSFYIELSYNSDKSEILNKDILSKALREMTTIFIGSGFTYVDKEQADMIAKVYIDAEISDYKKGVSKKYDFLSKVTIKVYEKNNELIEQSNQNEFLSGENLTKLAVDSISKSSSRAAKDIVASLSKVTKNHQEKTPEVISKLKIDVQFEGEVNYKFFELINNVIKDSSSRFKVLKRTIKYGESFNLLVLSKLESQRLAEYIIDNVPIKDSFEVINITDNSVVFRINK